MSFVSFWIELFIFAKSIFFLSFKGITDFDIPRNSAIGSKIVKDGSGMMKCPLLIETYFVINSNRKDEPAETKRFSFLVWLISANFSPEYPQTWNHTKMKIWDCFASLPKLSAMFQKDSRWNKVGWFRYPFFNKLKLGVFAKILMVKASKATLPKKAVFSQSLLLIFMPENNFSEFRHFKIL